MGAGDIAVRLEKAHGEGIALDKGATNEFSKDVEGDLDTSHCVDNADRDDEDETHDDTVKNNSDGGVRGVDSNGSTADSDGKDEGDKVPPLRDFLVLLHKAVVDVENTALFDLLLLGRTEAVEQVAEAHHNLRAMEESGVGDDGAVHGKEDHVDNGVGSGEIRGRVGLVLFDIHDAAVIKNATDVVALAKAVIRLVGVDGKISGAPDVAVVHGGDDGEGDGHAGKVVCNTEERQHEGIPEVGDNVPIKGGQRVEAEAAEAAGDDGQLGIVGRDPDHPGEVGQALEDVVGEPEPHKHGGEGQTEELETAHAPEGLERTGHGRIRVSVEGGIQGNGDERLRPDAVRRVHEEATADARQAVADEVGGQGNEDLVAKAERPGLVEELRQVLDPDDVVCVGGGL